MLQTRRLRNAVCTVETLNRRRDLGEVRVDVRVVAATNLIDIDSPSSSFRRDLYHRLKVVTIDLPPLRARDGDEMNQEGDDV